jgi:lipid A ethanolaminephosphotransferase
MKQRLNNLHKRLKERFSSTLSLTKFSITLSAATLILYHYPLFRYIAENIESGFNGVLIFITMIVVMLAANFMVYYLLLYLGRIVGRLLLAFLFVGNGVTLYFINSYNVLIDRSMMGNVFNTRFSEASGYFSLGAILYFVVLGLIPAIYVIMRKVEWGTFKRFLSNTGISIAAMLMPVFARKRLNVPHSTLRMMT